MASLSSYVGEAVFACANLSGYVTEIKSLTESQRKAIEEALDGLNPMLMWVANELFNKGDISLNPIRP